MLFDGGSMLSSARSTDALMDGRKRKSSDNSSSDGKRHCTRDDDDFYIVIDKRAELALQKRMAYDEGFKAGMKQGNESGNAWGWSNGWDIGFQAGVDWARGYDEARTWPYHVIDNLD